MGALHGDLGPILAEILNSLQHQALVPETHPAVGRPLLELRANFRVGELRQLLQLYPHV